MASTTPSKPSTHDVVLGFDENPGNKLLQDLVALRRGTSYLEFPSQHLVDLIKNGTSLMLPMEEGVPPAFLLQGNFWMKEGSSDKWLIMTDEAARDYVTSSVDPPPVVIERVKQFMAANKDPTATTDKPAPDDVKLMVRTDTDASINQSNQNFLKLVGDVLAENKLVNPGSPSDMRVERAFEVLNRLKTKNASFYAADGDSWRILDNTEAAEIVLVTVFEKLRELFPSADCIIGSNVPIVPTGNYILPEDWSQPGSVPVDNPSKYDVLFGRGGMTNMHLGNRRFRDIISLHRPDYVRAIKIEKPNVARRIVAAIRTGNPPGRFLKKNSKDHKWYDVGNRHATEKTSQALREKSAAEKGKNKEPNTEKDARKRLLEQAMYEARMTRMRLAKEGATLPASFVDSANGAASGGSQPGQYVPLTPLVTPGAAAYAASMQPAKGKVAAAKGNDSGDSKPAATTTIGADLNLSPEELKQQQERKLQLASLAAMNDKEDPPSTDRGAKDAEGNLVVTDNDILCGRGGLTNHHKGNKRFRDIIALHRSDYVRAPKVHKPAVARLIVRAIRNSDPPGRFLKKDTKTRKWYDIGDKRAAEKTSQALREKSGDDQKGLPHPASTMTAVPLPAFQNPAFMGTGTTAMLLVPPVGEGLPTIQQVPNDKLPEGVKPAPEVAEVEKSPKRKLKVLETKGKGKRTKNVKNEASV